MKVSEIQIGDWVIPHIFDSTLEPSKIVGIYYNSYKGKDYVDWVDCEVWDELSLNEIEPIPLTPEILEKNGVVANKHVYPYPYYEYTNEEGKVKVGFAFPQGNRTSYKEPWVYIDSENVFIEHLPCIFVHQLQHALRLCGIKKEIKL